MMLTDACLPFLLDNCALRLGSSQDIMLASEILWCSHNGTPQRIQQGWRLLNDIAGKEAERQALIADAFYLSLWLVRLISYELHRTLLPEYYEVFNNDLAWKWVQDSLQRT